MTDTFKNHDQLVVHPIHEKFLEEDVGRVRGYNLDVILQLSGGYIHKETAETSRYGIWFLHFGNYESCRRDISGFWEMYTKTATCSMLRAFIGKQCSNRILSVSWTATKKYSLYLNRARIYRKCAHIVVNYLRTIHQGGCDHFEKNRTDTSMGNGLSSTYRCPDNLKMLVFLGKIFLNLFTKTTRMVFIDDLWIVGLRKKQNLKELGDYKNINNLGFQQIKSRRGSFLADPFIIGHNGKNYLFCEEFRKKDWKGVISVVEILDEYHTTHPRIVLERPYHLSYPFLLRYAEELLMIPETSKNSSIELYKCVQFPDKWVLDTVLFEGILAVDTTVLYENGLYWLFTCQNNGQTDTYDGYDELYLYWANSIRGPWYPHPQNPIVSDIRRARCAGSIIRLQNSFIRPSQDCSVQYGKRINFNHITKLTQTEYQEEPVGLLENIRYLNAHGVHTWNSNEHFDTIDVAVQQFKIKNFVFSHE